MFDNKSVALIILPSLWASLIVLGVNWRIHRNMPGVGWWPAGLAVTLAGFVLRANQGSLPAGLSIIAGALLIVGGQMLMLRGLCAFAGRPMFTRTCLSTLALLAVALWMLLRQDAPEGMRLTAVTLGLAVSFLLQGALLIDIGKREGAIGVLVLGITEAMVLTLFAGRAVFMLLGTPIEQVSFSPNQGPGPQAETGYLRLAVFVNSTVLAVLMAYGYILLATYRVKAQLTRLARVDMLTGAPNRLAFEEEMARLEREAARSGGQVALALLDIDRFKQINDSHGHAVGDTMLRHVTAIIAAGLPPGSVYARIGGEEFAIARVDTGRRGLDDPAERIRRAVEASPLPVGDSRLSATISIGVAMVPPGSDAVHRLHRCADEALYRAKSAGRNRVEVAAAA